MREGQREIEKLIHRQGRMDRQTNRDGERRRHGKKQNQMTKMKGKKIDLRWTMRSTKNRTINR